MIRDVLTVTLNPAIDWTVSVTDFTLGEVNRAAGETVEAGGKGINVAALLADFGLSVAATGFLGRDNDAPFCELFTQRGIQDSMVRLDGQTRVGIKIVADSSGETTDINFPGLSPSAANLATLSTEVERIQAKWVVLAGSLPPTVTPDIYAQLTRKVRGWGGRVVLDSSGPALQLALDAPREGLPHVVKPNLAEMEEWAGSKLHSMAAVTEAALKIIDRGVELVAVSMGGDGMVLVSRDEAILAKPPAITVGSTVGAGDALVAGLVTALKHGMSKADSARLATAFALDVLQRNGTYGVSRESVAARSRQVTLQPLELPQQSIKPLPTGNNRHQINKNPASPIALLST